MKLTKAAVACLTLPPAKTDLIIFDDEISGFGLRLRAGGKRTWIAQYRIGTKQRRVTLGDVTKLDADAARKAARDRLAQVTLGGDPQKAKHEARARAAMTLRTVVDHYLAQKVQTVRPRSYREIQRYLTHHWRDLHGLPIHEIKRRDVAAGLTAITTESGTVAAARARVALSGLFAWAVREGITEANPVIGTNKPPEPKSRDRVLSDSEIAEIWKASGDNDYGRIVRLALLTGARRDEIGGLRFSEIDLERDIIALPAERTKNRRPHVLPLSPVARAILESVPRRAGRDYLFGEGEGAFSGWSKAKAALDARIFEARRKAAGKRTDKANQMTPWRLHDLRRTCATVMADRLGVQPHIIEATLNHASGHKAGVAGIYNRSTYEREVKAALALWADHVRAVVEGSPRKVVSLHSKIA